MKSKGATHWVIFHASNKSVSQVSSMVFFLQGMAGSVLHHQSKVSGKPRCLHSLEIQIHLLDHVIDGGQLEVSRDVMGEGWLSG